MQTWRYLPFFDRLARLRGPLNPLSNLSDLGGSAGGLGALELPAGPGTLALPRPI